MNDTTTVKQSEFVFRRLADSFDQFVSDLWASVPLWLLALAAALVVARVVYRYANPAAHAPGSKDQLRTGLAIGAWCGVAALVVTVLVTYYQRDAGEQPAETDALTALGSNNTVKWFAFTVGAFVLGTAFAVWMYVRDTKTIRWYFAVPLALLRISVYAILCFVFLLPAMQTFETTNKQSRVVILLDISESVTKVTDEVSANAARKPKTRTEVLIEFLTDESVAFVKKLLEKNPVAVYAIGTRLDESPAVLGPTDPAWGKAEWEAFAQYDFRPFLARDLSPEGAAQLRQSPEWQDKAAGTPDWAAPFFTKREDQAFLKSFGLSPEDTDKFRKALDRLDKRTDVARTIARGTNVPDSITAAVNRESSNMVQGIIVFSDGRSNLGSETSLNDLRDRATREKIPVFTVTVGEDRQAASIAISEVQAPDSAPIDEAWKIVVEADGVNLANKEVEVFLDLFKPGTNFKDGPADHTLKEKLTFAPGDPPHGQAEFVIDPAKLPESLTTESKDAAIKKRVLLEGKWNARARIAKDPQEAFAGAEHVRERPDVSVVQQKLRILLVAGAPSRDFSFLRTLLVREVQDKRATLTTFVQNEAGTSGKLTPEDGEKVILRFPNKLDLTNKKVDPDDKPYNLNEYDVLIAFDPDWTELSQQQADDLSRWVREGGGGLLYVAGPINTFQMARVEEGSRLSPLVGLLPVLPADILARNIQASARVPRRLYLHPERLVGSDLLKLDDKVADDPIAGWEPFFTDRAKYAADPDLKQEYFPRRGFYSAYPVKDVRPQSAVLADFGGVGDNGEPQRVPWLVTNNPLSPYRSVFLASSDLWRLRVFEPENGTGREFYERFWVKLMKYAAAKRNFKAPRGRVLVGKEGVSGSPLRVQARILNESAKPYEVGRIDPKFKVVQETPGGEKREFGPFDLAAKVPPSGVFDGYYAGQVQLDLKQFPPGDSVYRVVVDVPDAAGEQLTGEFKVRRSDPEMDNTKPDFGAMLKMASDFDKDFRTRLTGTTDGELGKVLPRDGAIQKLAFRLADREALKLIPQCMKTEKRQSQTRGPIHELWDRGFVVKEIDPQNPPAKYALDWWLGRSLSYVLLLVTLLLSLEWIGRKLLRLA
jgi:hypothetical protein